MSAESEGREGTRDLELTSEDADRVKGGMLPIDGGGAGGASDIVSHKKRKRRKRKNQNQVGPYKGLH